MILKSLGRGLILLLQAAVGLEGMADGAVLSGIPRAMALKFSAHAVMVGEKHCYFYTSVTG